MNKMTLREFLKGINPEYCAVGTWEDKSTGQFCPLGTAYRREITKRGLDDLITPKLVNITKIEMLTGLTRENLNRFMQIWDKQVCPGKSATFTYALNQIEPEL
jgi:hypothetical protein